VWSVVDFTCLKTLEGHNGPVLCLKFIRSGSQLLSGAADGVMKLWSVKDGEVIAAVIDCFAGGFHRHCADVCGTSLARSV
jgi:WD40 repeat protein